MARVDWYRDRADGLWTLEVDPQAVLTTSMTWALGRYPGIASVTPQPTISEGGNPSVVVNSFNDAQMIFTVTSSGGTVTLRITFAGGQSDDLTLRFRSVST